ncbi:hypothetical protein HK105_202884 [Polyrhizophydium stewartii]|uniref:Cyclic nucleotide-binding domain-containing protein n=1 Tax=Polyrhizophydium stewartii TaxID=2732419 RepID=A0ABR4NDJ5_9FUNG
MRCRWRQEVKACLGQVMAVPGVPTLRPLKIRKPSTFGSHERTKSDGSSGSRSTSSFSLDSSQSINSPAPSHSAAPVSREFSAMYEEYLRAISSENVAREIATTASKAQGSHITSLINYSDTLHQALQTKLSGRHRHSMSPTVIPGIRKSADPNRELAAKVDGEEDAGTIFTTESSDVGEGRGSKYAAARRLIKHRWRVGYTSCIMVYRLIKLDMALVPTLVKFSVETNLDPNLLSNIIRNHVPVRDNMLTSHIKSFIKSERTEQQIECIAQLLAIRLHSFGAYSPVRQRELCKIMQYECVPEGKLIIKEGHRPNAFYFIISGQVDIFTVRNSVKCRFRLCKAGDSFGDLSLRIIAEKMYETRRTASISTVVDTELLRIEKEDYMMIRSISNQAQREANVQRLYDLPYFCGDREIVERIAEHASFTTFQPNQVIVSEGSTALQMYWVMSGSCKAYKMMHTVRRKNAKGKDVIKILDDKDTSYDARLDEKPTYEMMSLFDFEPGDFFPAMTPPSQPVLPGDDSSKLQYVAELGKNDELGVGVVSQCTVMSGTFVELMMIPQHYFALLATPTMVVQALDDGHFKITTEEIVAAFEKRSKWQEYRKDNTSRK